MHGPNACKHCPGLDNASADIRENINVYHLCWEVYKSITNSPSIITIPYPSLIVRATPILSQYHHAHTSTTTTPFNDLIIASPLLTAIFALPENPVRKPRPSRLWYRPRCQW